MTTPPQKQLVEQALLRFFMNTTTNTRRKIIEETGTDYGRFLAAVRIAQEAELSLPDADKIAERLRRIRVTVKAPRLGKKGRLFLLRHWSEARKLRESGATYVEIAEYLRQYRRFHISVGYLKRVMEGVA
jgi:hypothetical protein